MPSPRFVLLGDDPAFARDLTLAAPGIRVVATDYLDALGRSPRPLFLLIDARSLKRCCVERIRRLSHGCPDCRVSPPPARFGAHSEPLSERTLIRTTSILAVQTRSKVQRTSPSLARKAWSQRSQLLDARHRSHLAQRFLKLARSHDHGNLSVASAAKHLEVEVRQLNRLCHKWFDFPPGVIIDLVRVVSLTKRICSGRRKLSHIAADHGFPCVPALISFTWRFVGATPKQLISDFGQSE